MDLFPNLVEWFSVAHENPHRRVRPTELIDDFMGFRCGLSADRERSNVRRDDGCWFSLRDHWSSRFYFAENTVVVSDRCQCFEGTWLCSPEDHTALIGVAVVGALTTGRGCTSWRVFGTRIGFSIIYIFGGPEQKEIISVGYSPVWAWGDIQSLLLIAVPITSKEDGALSPLVACLCMAWTSEPGTRVLIDTLTQANQCCASFEGSSEFSTCASHEHHIHTPVENVLTKALARRRFSFLFLQLEIVNLAMSGHCIRRVAVEVFDVFAKRSPCSKTQRRSHVLHSSFYLFCQPLEIGLLWMCENIDCLQETPRKERGSIFHVRSPILEHSSMPNGSICLHNHAHDRCQCCLLACNCSNVDQ